MHTVIGVCSTFSQAEEVVQDLVNNGFLNEHMSIIAANTTDRLPNEVAPPVPPDHGRNTAAGATAGAVLGSLAGLVVGLGVLTIPGMGPIIAAGPLAATLGGAGIGAGAGSLLGALVDLGISEEEAQSYLDAIQHGKVLICVQAEERRLERATAILQRHVKDTGAPSRATVVPGKRW